MRLELFLDFSFIDYSRNSGNRDYQNQQNRRYTRNDDFDGGSYRRNSTSSGGGYNNENYRNYDYNSNGQYNNNNRNYNSNYQNAQNNNRRSYDQNQKYRQNQNHHHNHHRAVTVNDHCTRGDVNPHEKACRLSPKLVS